MHGIERSIIISSGSEGVFFFLDIVGWTMARLLQGTVRMVHLFKEQGTSPALSFGSRPKQSKEPACLGFSKSSERRI